MGLSYKYKSSQLLKPQNQIEVGSDTEQGYTLKFFFWIVWITIHESLIGLYSWLSCGEYVDELRMIVDVLLSWI